MIPTVFPCICRFSKADKATAKVSESKEPKPSSMNKESTCICLEDKEAKARAKAKETKKVSPPERV